MNLSSFYRRHASEVAWIFGKGPSLDTFDQASAGSLRICINESVLHVDSPTYFFAHDEVPIKRIAAKFPNSCTAVLEHCRSIFAQQCGLAESQICTYHKLQQNVPTEADLLIDSNSDSLIGVSSTVHSALHFCKLIGASKVVLVGFDGTGGYANCLGLDLPVGGGQHERIKKDTVRLIELLGLESEFACEVQIKGDSIDYQSLYDKLRRNGYHQNENSSHLHKYVPWIFENLKFQNVLDIGCSSGASLELFSQKGVEATGLDVSILAVEEARKSGRNVVHGCATRLPFPDNSFDLVCSADVMEHLSPNDGSLACKEACRVARRNVFMKIAEKEDSTEKWKAIAGHPLHLTTQSIDWWKNQISALGSFVYLQPEVFCIELND